MRLVLWEGEYLSGYECMTVHIGWLLWGSCAPRERQYDLCPRRPLLTQSSRVTSILSPHIHNLQLWKFTYLCLLPHWHKQIIRALSTYNCVLPLHWGPIINHLEGPVSTFSSPRGGSWHWASEATRLPPPPLRGLVGGPPCCRLAPLLLEILPVFKISVLNRDDHE